MSNLTPQQVIETLSKIARDIDQATDDITRADEQAVMARMAHKKNYARVFLDTQGSMDVKRYTADLETADTTMLASELADQKHRAAVSQIRTLRDRLEVGRSLGPLIRLEWGQS